MSYSFFNSGSSVGFFTGSVGIQTGGWFSSSNPDLIASGSASGYYVGNIYKPSFYNNLISGSSSALITPINTNGAWTGAFTYRTESGANSHGIPVGSQSIFTSSWYWGTASYGQMTASISGAQALGYGQYGRNVKQNFTASYIIGVNDLGNFSIEESTSNRGAQNRTFYFASSSGKMGIGTNTPTNDVDIKADTIKFRNNSGTEEVEFRQGKMTAKKYANRAAGAAVVLETSGSELVMAYSPGTFDVPTTASAGDRLGTITWEDLSIGVAGAREDATAMEIFGSVQAVASDGSAIKGSMNFGIGSVVAGQPISTHLVISSGHVNVTGSNLAVTGRAIHLGNTADDDSDKYINFLSKTSGKRWVAGIDVSAAAFVIDQTANNVPQSTSDFSLASGGALTLGGILTCTQINTGNGATEIYDMNQDLRTDDDVTFNKISTANMPGFTGSTITVDGGTF